jgi:mono/diheme cytochrome c family protein
MSSRLLRSLSSLSFVIAALAVAGCGSSDTTGGGGGDNAAIAKGADLVKTNGCASCHSSKNADEVLSGADTPITGKEYGANLTPDKETGLGTWTDAQIGDAITKGIDDEGEMLCGSMQRYSSFSEEDVAGIVAYLKSIPAVKHAVTESECP